MASVTTRSWATVLVIAAIALMVLVSASPEAREQAQHSAGQIGAIIVQIFIGLGDLFRSLISFDIKLGPGQ